MPRSPTTRGHPTMSMSRTRCSARAWTWSSYLVSFPTSTTTRTSRHEPGPCAVSGPSPGWSCSTREGPASPCGFPDCRRWTSRWGSRLENGQGPRRRVGDDTREGGNPHAEERAGAMGAVSGHGLRTSRTSRDVMERAARRETQPSGRHHEISQDRLSSRNWGCRGALGAPNQLLQRGPTCRPWLG